MKKIVISLLIILFIIGLHLSIRFYLNERYILAYNNSNYSLKNIFLLKILNVPDGYAVYFNEGNYYYQTQDYNKAISLYEKSLVSAPKSKVCPIKLNISLSKLVLIKYENNPKLRDELISVQNILLEDNCATEDDNGTYESSQQLYNEIKEYLNQEGGGSGSSSEPVQPTEEEDPEIEEIKEKIKEQQEGAEEERENIENEFNYNFNYYNIQYW